MKKIISRLKPFSMEQTLLVYENGNKIDFMNTTMQDLNKDLFLLMEKHDVNRFDIVGPKKYSKGIKNQILKHNETQFTKKELEINVI